MFEKQLTDEELKKVAGGFSDENLPELRNQALNTLNQYFILPQSTIDYINSSTNAEAIFFVAFKTAFYAKTNKSAEEGFVSVCQLYGIPYAGYSVR